MRRHTTQLNFVTCLGVSEADVTRSLAVTKRPCDCCVGQLWPNVTGRQYFADIIGPPSRTVTYSAFKAIKFGEITQHKGYYAIQGHSRSGNNRKPVCDFLLLLIKTLYL